MLIINSAIPRLEEITDGLPCRVITYGKEDSDYCPANVTYNELGFGSFDLMRGKTCLGHFDLMVPGEHNVSNAVASLAAADLLQADYPSMYQDCSPLPARTAGLSAKASSTHHRD